MKKRCPFSWRLVMSSGASLVSQTWHSRIEPLSRHGLFQLRHSFPLHALLFLGAASLSLVPPLFQPQPALSAEKVLITYGPLEFSLAVDDLETFAETGEITGGLRLYARFLDEQALQDFRQFLQRSFEVDPFVLSQLTYSTIGEEVLQRLGSVIRTDAGLNGFYALRSAMILSADDPVEGLTMINFLRQYPSYSIRISAAQLLEIRRAATLQLNYREAVVKAIAQEAATEAANAPPLDLSQLPPLGEPGPYEISQRTLQLSRDRLALSGETIARPFRVLLFVPEDISTPAPVVVISHGLGSTPEAFAYLGEHLASHGFVAVLPQHIGSDASRREGALQGILNSAVTPVEFVDRPFDITYTLNELARLAETDTTLSGKLNLDQVGVIGHSFGGYTALALAGADLNTQTLNEECASIRLRLDASFVLQCAARDLPPYIYQLRDPRVKAAIAISPLTSLVFGQEGMSQINVPTMIISGSSDFIASAVPEQIHPFLWLTTPEKYLALIIPSSHVFADATPTNGNTTTSRVGDLLAGPDPMLGRDYIQELSLAFMETYLNDRPEYRQVLSAAYGQSVSQEPLTLEIVESLTADQLEQAFGATPPIPIFPATAAAPDTEDAGAVLEEIAATGILRAAVRTDVFPFGFVDDRGEVTGYCVDLLNSLTEELGQQLNTPVRLDITTPSTLENRFEIIQDDVAQVECGPNTIRDDISNVEFSVPFFLTGTQFLVPQGNVQQVNPLGQLAGVRIGVLNNTITAAFVRQRYPNAEIVVFPSTVEISSGIEAVSNNEIDAFAEDGILLFGELTRQNLANDYALLPTGPLTCNPYGLLLADGDSRWQAAVNNFITSPTAAAIRTQWFTSEVSSYLFLALDRCVQ